MPTPKARRDRGASRYGRRAGQLVLRHEATFMQVLLRRPTASEQARLASAVSESSPNQVRELMWSMMQSTEFLTY